ncbi:Uma2 family endonuclease [Deinococcus aquaedulcis]|uniref:Uma2 family endonuclease n=1 Tax=Deinococcus aquaedulcis TaxID=2840455 RepID=UPI001C832E46|nr:Uma2 family endonuclease [Deinococcus aquaedulcis]
MSDPAFKAMSVEAYLRSEEHSPFKREYVGGFVYPLHAQAGASEAHVLICTNLTAALHASARRAGCRLYQSDMKLALAGASTFFYPDVMVVCDPDDRNTGYKTAPCLLIEVLSASTVSHDRVGKFGLYTALPSLQMYLIVEQSERRVYAYRRAGDQWPLRELAGEGEIELPCLNMTLSLDEMYAGVLPSR